jgi:predicted RNase H-like HicB family nuclease
LSPLPKSLITSRQRRYNIKERGKPYIFTAKDLLRKRKRTYSVIVVEEEDGGFSGRCVELLGAISQGETLAELKRNMKDAISLIQRSNDRDIVRIVSEQVMKNSQLIEVSA